jgi:hypothetical protein
MRATMPSPRIFAIFSAAPAASAGDAKSSPTRPCAYQDELAKRLDDLMARKPTHHAGLTFQQVVRQVRRHLFIFMTSRSPSAHEQWLRTLPAPLRNLPQDHQPLSDALGSRASRQHLLRHRNRALARHRRPRSPPPHTRRRAPHKSDLSNYPGSQSCADRKSTAATTNWMSSPPNPSNLYR